MVDYGRRGIGVGGIWEPSGYLGKNISIMQRLSYTDFSNKTSSEHVNNHIIQSLHALSFSPLNS